MRSDDEGELLAQLERQADDGFQQVDAGKSKAAEAIRKIHEQRLWPQTMTWGEYLRDRFDIGEDRARQLFDFLAVREAIMGDCRPERERQTRALRKTGKENWQAVWDRACKQSGKKSPTSTTIETIIRGMAAEKRANDRPGNNGSGTNSDSDRPNLTSEPVGTTGTKSETTFAGQGEKTTERRHAVVAGTSVGSKQTNLPIQEATAPVEPPGKRMGDCNMCRIARKYHRNRRLTTQEVKHAITNLKPGEVYSLYRWLEDEYRDRILTAAEQDANRRVLEIRRAFERQGQTGMGDC